MNEPLAPVAGLVAGKYEVLKLIGRGGMGSVWEGRHTSLGTRVAIKFIDQEYAESQDARSRFITEARAAATIESRHAIRIFDHGVTDDGRPYMVMELLTGEPLDKRIERLGTVSLEQTARVIGHVCRALQRAHDAGIIHRDLKPENIFLVRSPDDDDEIAKVLDFGIAKIKGPPGEKEPTSSTKTGAVIGTPYYMSPEQARGLRNLDYRTDLWSLGVIAYKCVTGVLPFEGESVGDLLVKICTSPLPTPSERTPQLPPSFDAWFSRALEREPAQRFASALELSDALAVAAGLSVRRAPPSSRSDENPVRIAPGGPSGDPSATPLPAAGVTSPPFTSNARAAKSTRGIWVAAVAAAVVGASIGVTAVVKMAAAPKQERLQGVTTATATATATATTTATPTATTTATPTATTTATPTPTPTATPTATPTPHLTPKPSIKPAPSTKPIPKPPPAPADPGY